MRVQAVVSCLMLVGCPSAQESPAQPTSKGGPDGGDDDDAFEPNPTPTTTGADPTTTSSTTTAATATTESPDSTTEVPASTGDPPPPGTCGDGIKDPQEGCDLGYLENSDGGACTQSCQLPFCGDGLLWIGQEECDEGLENNSQIYGGCSELCWRNAHCGDGKLQPEHEECDASAPPVEGDAPCDPANCRLSARLAFVTAETFTGELGGLQAADSRCALAAAAVGLDNAANFKAWLSDGVTGPIDRLVKGKAAKGYPYALRSGKLLAKDLDAIVNLGLQVPLDVTEHGTTLPPQQLAWTATNGHGEPEDPVEHCQQWSSMAFKDVAGVGQISPATLSDLDLFAWRIDVHWTRYATKSCASDIPHLYCFED